jgi:hypothetical protein
LPSTTTQPSRSLVSGAVFASTESLVSVFIFVTFGY